MLLNFTNLCVADQDPPLLCSSDNISHVLSTKNKFQLFKHVGTKCNQNAVNNLVKGCDYLKRLSDALKCYHDNKNQNNKLWIEFCLHIYGNQMLDDYHHLLLKHQHNLFDLKKELLNKYKFPTCLLKKCPYSQRHLNSYIAEKFNDKKLNDLILRFYEREYDSLHFNLFHLFNVGYRFKKQEHGYLKNKEHNEPQINCIDNEFAEMAQKIKCSRDKYKNMFHRLKVKNRNNKYNITVQSGETDETTFIDKLFEYLQVNGIVLNELAEIYKVIKTEEYDSDAIKEDVIHNIEGSNVYRETQLVKWVQLVKECIAHSEGIRTSNVSNSQITTN